MSRIVDNGAVTLASALNDVLPHSVAFDACVGYFNLRGWSLLREAIGQLQVDEGARRTPVRLLVGMALRPDMEVRQAIEGGVPPLDHSLAARRIDQALVDFADQLIWGVPTVADQAALRRLRDDLDNGLLKVKFWAREPLHAKLYVAHLAGGLRGYRAVVGSSNFTSAGLVKQGELSLEETDQQLTAELADWFEQRWDDMYAIDITHELISILEQSWIREDQPSPYHVYLRLAYELSRDARDGLNLDIPAEIRKILLPHQISAVQVATKLLERKGIAVIGDVVGLGKTLTGTAIAATAGESVLVIAPKNLVRMWEDHLHRYNVPGKVLSLSMVLKELPDLRRFKLVLIDESHNLRNRTRKAWDAIRSYIELNDSRVVLLTATMYNARHKDIGGQLGLKLAQDQPLGIRPERHVAQVGPLELAKKTGGRLDSLAAFERSEHNEDWQRLLSEYLVRRTRAFLETTYGTRNPKTGDVELRFPDGTTFSFPKRIPGPLEYAGGPTDPNDRIVTDETFGKIAGLTFARHQLGLYLLAEPETEGAVEETLVEDLRTAVSAAGGFIRTTTLKRLTSSAHAFMLTIKRMIARNAVLDYAIAEGLPIPLGNFSDQYFDLDAVGDVDADEGDGVDDAAGPTWGVGWSDQQWRDYAATAHSAVLAKKPKGIRWARPDLFDTEALRDAVRQDSETLQELVDDFGIWAPEDDTKLQALAGLIESLPEGGKVLVFSEYKDTVEYVAQHLPRWTSRPMASASGTSADAVRLARRFAPKANENIGGLPDGETEVDVLVTTDVLSEGQNLQDAAVVVNWDLPWTIIRMIQRAGRVDRVGQSAPTISVLSFQPHEGVEKVILLRARLKKRLQDAAHILGGGEQFFDDDIFIDVGGMFDGSQKLDEDEGEVDVSSYALNIWESAQPNDRRSALELQQVVYSTKAVAEDDALAVITFGRTDSGTDILVRTSAEGDAFITPMEALVASESRVNELPAPSIEDHLDQVVRAATMMSDQAATSTVLLNHGIRRRLYEYLSKQVDRIDLHAITRARIAEVVEAVTNNPLRDSVKGEVAGILKSAKMLGDDAGQFERLIELFDDGLLVDARELGADRVQIVTSMGFNPISLEAEERVN